MAIATTLFEIGHSACMSFGEGSQPWSHRDSFDRSIGRELYGQDPRAYDVGRPPYSERVWEVLGERCHLGPGADALEIGPGSGTATRGLASAGAVITVVEPNPALAKYLSEAMREARLTVIVAPWEDVDLADLRFDLVVAATSFHWVDPRTGLAKVREHLRPGAWFAMWWTAFEDPSRRDDFDLAVQALIDVSPHVLPLVRPPAELDEGSERAELEDAGFVDVGRELVHTELSLDAGEVRRMYASLAGVLRHPPTEQPRLLDEIEMLVDRDFGGRVTRSYVTTLYTARTRRNPEYA